MTEFMFKGAVRYGFGFYNPNHAAALICAVMPFLWGAWISRKDRTSRIIIALVSAVLLVALMLTFSRTGALVLGLELISFCILTRRRYWRFVIGAGVVFMVALVIGGVFGRFAMDKAVMNRFDIWEAGAALFASNPWFGVGLGNSGDLVSTFILPDRIMCRTLVNSHLTLFAEFGIFAGILWMTMIICALINGVKRPVAWTAFLGLCVSAFSASIFDWDVLFDFRTLGNLPVSNFILSWLMLILFISIALSLCFGKINWKNKVFSFAAALVVCIGMIVFYSNKAPSFHKEMIVKHADTMPLVLYDDRWDVKSVLPFLPEGYFLMKKSWEMRESPPDVKTDKAYLFGKCAVFASSLSNAKLTFVSPPEFAELPENTEKVYLKEYSEHREGAFAVEYY